MSASTETPDFAAQIIYVDSDWVLKFAALFILKRWWLEINPTKPKQYRLRFAVNIDLRTELPASLRGKFSHNPIGG